MDVLKSAPVKIFRLGDLFTITHGKRLTKSMRVPGSIPLITAGWQNQGVAELIGNAEMPMMHDAITIDMFGHCFYHDGCCTGDDNVYFFENKKINRSVKLYITSCVSNSLQGEFSYGRQFRQNDADTVAISLPIEVDDIGHPIIDDTRKYHPDGFVPDWEYMQNCIVEAERKHIAELEQYQKEELEQYLAAADLVDHVLTSKERNILASSRYTNNVKQQNIIGSYKETREFRVGDLFDIHPTKAYYMSNGQIYEQSGHTPVLSNSFSNNGIGGYCGLDPTEDGGIITFSDTTTGVNTMFYQCSPFIGYPHVQGMYPKVENAWDEDACMYLISVMRRTAGAGWNYANKFTRKKVAEIRTPLPIQTDTAGQPVIDEDKTYHPDGFIPDWEYMAAYIRVIEKLVIQDVEMHNAQILKITKEIVEQNNQSAT